MLDYLLVGGVGLALGAVVALRYIAPRTMTLKDDQVLAFLEKYVVPFLPSEKAAEVKSAVLSNRDHR